MFTRVTIQGSLVALQQHIRAKAPSTTRERSHSLDDTTIDQRPKTVSESQGQAYPQFVAPAPVAVDYLAGWGANTNTTPTKVSGQVNGIGHGAIKASQTIENIPVEEEEEVILHHEYVDEAPTASYHYGSRELVIHNVCAFLETWLSSLKQHTATNACNPHGWECLRRQKLANSGLPPSCHSNSSNNYNTAHASCGDPLHYVYGTTIPTISMKDYLLRLTEYFRTSDAVFIIATHYFSRAVDAHEKGTSLSCNPHVTPLITPWSLHRVYFACCVLAAKWLEDTPFDNQYYASVGGISTFELSHVETALLGLLDFNVFISSEAVDEAWEALQKLGGSFGDVDAATSCINCLALPSSCPSKLASQQLSVAAQPFRPTTHAGTTNSVPWLRGTGASAFSYQAYPQYNHTYYGQQYIASKACFGAH